MAIGWPASHTERFSTDICSNSDELRIAVRETINVLSWSTKEETQGQIIVTTGMSLGSYGEEILINFLPGNSISITSKGQLPSGWFDWGKNKVNVDKFLAEIKRCLRRCLCAAPDSSEYNKNNDNSAQIRQVLKEYDEFTEVTCLECGYEGKMGIIESKIPWYFSWWVLIPVLFTGVGTVPAFILGFCRFASKKYTVECPMCSNTLLTK